jgi:Flp pilus assembly protein TadG
VTSRRADARGPGGDERGASETVQWALVVPVLLTTLLAIIQVGVWTHGRATVRHAAAAGAEAAASADSGATRGRAERTATEVARAGGLDGVRVEVRTRAGQVEVTTTARVDLLVDIGLSTVSGSASLPLEEVT